MAATTLAVGGVFGQQKTKSQLSLQSRRGRVHCRLERCSVRCAAAAEADSEVANTSESKTYGFVIANAKFMLQDEEHMVEVLRERKRVFKEKNEERDFWIVPEPKFLEAMPDVSAKVARPCVALVSTNLTWIKFMQLRLDRVLKGQFEASGILEEILASDPFSQEDISKLKGVATPEARPPPGAERKEAGCEDEWSAPYDTYEAEWWKSFLVDAE